MEKEKVLRFLNECMAVKEQEIALYEKYSVCEQGQLVLCGYPKREIHIYERLDEIAKLLKKEIKTEQVADINKKIVYYNGYEFFEIVLKEQ